MIDRPARAKRPLRGWMALSLMALLALMLSAVGGRTRAEGKGDDDAPDVRVMVRATGDQEPDVQVFTVDDGDDDEGSHHAHRGYLGVSLDEDTTNPEGGAKVESVVADSPADRAGIKRGDTIVGFAGQTIRGPSGLTEKIHAAHPKDKVDVKLVRKDGKKETVTVELGDRPRPRGFWYGYGDSDAPTPMPDLDNLGEKLGKLKKLQISPRAWRWQLGDHPRLGVELVETTAELREFLGGSREAGVLVGKVLTGTPAQKSGIKVGDLIAAVDGERVVDSSDLIEALSEKQGKTIDLEVVRDRRTIHVQVAIPSAEEEEDEPRGPRALLRVVPPTPPVPPQPPVPAREPSLRILQRELQRALAEARSGSEAARAAREDVRDAVDRARHEMRRAQREARRMSGLVI